MIWAFLLTGALLIYMNERDIRASNDRTSRRDKERHKSDQ